MNVAVKVVAAFVGGAITGSYVMHNSMFKRITKIAFEAKAKKEQNEQTEQEASN